MLRFLSILILASLMPGCGKKTPVAATIPEVDPFLAVYEKAEAAKPPDPSKLFTRLPAAETGVKHGNPLDDSHPLRRLYYGYPCGGVAIGDLDGDGKKDLFFTSGPRKNSLYRQSATWKFEDVTAKAGVDGGDRWGLGAALVDLEGDGDLDIFVCNYDSPNQMFLNDGKGVFREVAKEAGLDLSDASLMSAFADYDRDGDLDVYVALNRLTLENGRPAKPPVEQRDGKLVVKKEYEKYLGLVQLDPKEAPLIWEIGRSDKLYRNDGPGPGGVPKFTDVSLQAGIKDRDHALSCLWTDPNNDGYPEIFVADDYVDPDHFYRNNGDGTFTDLAAAALGHTSWFSMGSDEGDVNNDGLLDLMVLDMSASSHYRQKVTMGNMGRFKWTMDNSEPRQMMRNVLHVNTGTGRYLQWEYLAGVDSSEWSWTPILADFDLDGWNDLLITNGVARDYSNSDLPFSEQERIGQTEWDFYKKQPPHPEKNLAFRNGGDFQFEPIGAAWGLDENSMAFAGASADLDDDGDVDLVVASLDQYVSVFRNNQADKARHWISFRLVGNAPNTQAIGAEIRIKHPTGTLVRRVNPHRGFLSSHDTDLQFGLGEISSLEEVVITWPNGERRLLAKPAIDQKHLIRQAEPAQTPAPEEPRQPPLFRASPVLAGIGAAEQAFDDFAVQPLLPNRYSQLGPALAWGDVNGDGLEDLFLGGSAGNRGQILINKGPQAASEQRFVGSSAETLAKDAAAEDMGAVFLDADGDADLDLYVASGSYEFKVGDPLLRDRLYLNNGQGQFQKAPENALPTLMESSSAVAAADYDQDGDTDLFVGTRLIPGEWPTASSSHLLLNDGKAKFSDAGAKVADPLTKNGLVTGAVWTDYDNDGWLDLVLSREWGSLQVLRNEKGTLLDATSASGLADQLGWWNSVASADLDGDGDMDFIAGNIGLNTKYHASKDKPIQVFYGDYSGDGRKQIVEAEYEDGTLFPIRGKSCSSRAMPHLKDRFPTFHSFAQSSLQEIYSETKLNQAEHYTANTLDTGVFWNDGGKFTFRPLPRIAQASPVFGIAVMDVNSDGRMDLVLAQNFFQPQNETGRFDTGLGQLLLNQGGQDFRPIWTKQSGIFVRGDAKALTVADLNGDNSPDLLFSQNDGPLQGVERFGETATRPLRLRGPAGNPGAIGARILAGKAVLAEIQAGSGYLSANGSVVWVTGQSLQVRWPDGKTQPIGAQAREIIWQR